MNRIKGTEYLVSGEEHPTYDIPPEMQHRLEPLRDMLKEYRDFRINYEREKVILSGAFLISGVIELLFAPEPGYKIIGGLGVVASICCFLS